MQTTTSLTALMSSAVTLEVYPQAGFGLSVFTAQRILASL